MPDIVEILEEIQVIFFYIKDDAQQGVHLQEAVGIFAGFCNKISPAADPDIAPDRRQDPSDRQGGVRSCGKQDLGEHGGGGRLAVCAADSDRKAVVAHELTQKLRPCQGRDLQFLHSFILRIVRMNGGGEDRQVDVFRDVFSPLSDHDPDPGVFQGTGDLGSGPVRP